ncbi:MAG: hypothetical protein SFV54_03705 [Bryobacteraceae bacterium]|nr:hypothetical protein [Bryobacteraceae bacterium]
MRVLLAGLVLVAGASGAVKEWAEGPLGARSLSKMTFSPDGTLFIGDSIGARIYALDLGDTQAATIAKPLSVTDLEGKIGAMIGADAKDVLIHDMAVNPISKNAYLTVSRGRRNWPKAWGLANDAANASVLLRVTPAGVIEEVKLDKVKHSSVEIVRPIAENKPAASWKKPPESERADAVSDLRFANGKLYVAGLSNEEFASTMRVYDYPFASAGSMVRLEVYHGAHGKWETESPVRSFLPQTINGKNYLLTSYLCTPVTLFALDDLKDKAHVKGTTIAELGFGNHPVDMVAYRSQGKDWVVIVNTTRGLKRISAEELAKAHAPITKPVEQDAGAKFEQVRGAGVLAMENFGEKHVLLLQRNIYTGELALVTWSL